MGIAPTSGDRVGEVLVRGPGGRARHLGDGIAVRAPCVTIPAGLMDLYDEVGMPATERRIPGLDGPPVDEEIRRWNEVSPRYELRVIGPPIPSET
jgi:hypothetical protein